MFIVIISLLSAFFVNDAVAACTGSSPTWTCTASSTAAQINSCISSATAGDTINIGAGSASWSTTVVITKGIRLKGAGAGSTTVTTSGASPLIRFLPTTQSLNPIMEVSGFTLNTANSCVAIELGQYNYQPTTFQTNVNINHNTFTGTTTFDSNYQYIFNYNMGGVIWKNTFNASGGSLFRSMGYGDLAIFALVPNAFGTANALYIEDNIFNVSSPGTYVADCQWGGTKRVWRYNTFNEASTPQGNGYIDVHGYRANGATSCFGDEVYGNNFVSSSGTCTWLSARGGKNLVLYNNAQTSGGTTASQSWTTGDSNCPSSYVDAQAIRVYAVNNRKNLTTAAGAAEQQVGCHSILECGWTCDTGTDYPQVDKQLFTQVSSYNGTSGVGCGTSLPANPSGYLSRTAYWVTSQSCNNVTGLVGDIVTNPTRNTITGALYNVQSGAWVKIFEPYTYPHPLTTGAPAPPPPRTPNPPPIQGIN